MQIEIINVAEPQTVPTKNGKSYQSIEIAYKRDGKVEGKKIMSFVNPKVFDSVQKFGAGDVVEVDTVKDDKGYWQWTHIVKSEGGIVEHKAVSTPTATKSVSNYETKEERAARQQLIIRQSSITSAIATLTANVKAQPTIDDVLNTAQVYVDWVNNNQEAKEVEAV